jgi:RNA polymerase sigma-70 factor, ECF subfamily
LNASEEKAGVPSFETIYEQYFDFVWSMTRRFGVPPETMDDVVQEVFMVVHKKLHTLESPEALRSWLYGIVRRRASGHHRQSWTQKTSGGVDVEDMPDVEGGMQSPADLAEQSDNVRKLWELLDGIDAPKREVFIMAELQELTCPEIAKALNIPLNTAYSRLRHAREAFDAALARQRARRGAQ